MIARIENTFLRRLVLVFAVVPVVLVMALLGLLYGLCDGVRMVGEKFYPVWNGTLSRGFQGRWKVTRR
jgi:hypothetical protein